MNNRTAPFYRLRIWRRIFLKVLLVWLIFDAVFIIFRPFDTIEPYSVFGHLVPLRNRFQWQLDAITLGATRIETLLNAYEIARPKAQDEFRVVLLGDSGIEGYGIYDNETIQSYMNSADVSVQNKHVRTYNLALNGPQPARDLLIGEAALDYKPDVIIWFVSPLSFDNNTPDKLVSVNQNRMTRLTEKFHLTDLNAQTYGHAQDSWWQHSILFKREDIMRWLSFQAFATSDYRAPSVGVRSEIDDPIPLTPLPDRLKQMPDGSWDNLAVLPQLTNVPVLFINEPVSIAPPSKPGSDVNYDSQFSRSFYDHYRNVFETFCQDHHLWHLDWWNLVPFADFLDLPVHHRALGNSIVAKELLKQIQGHFQ